MLNRISRGLRAVRENLGVLLALVVGFLLGILFLMPWIPYHLPDSTANILGAAGGAAIAVLGAEVVVTRKDRKRRDLAVEAASANATPLLSRSHTLRELVEAIELGPSRTAKIKGAYEFSRELHPAISDYLARTDFMAPLFQAMGGPGVIAFGTFKGGAASCQLAVDKTSWASMYDDDGALHSEREFCLAQIDDCIRMIHAGIDLMRLA